MNRTISEDIYQKIVGNLMGYQSWLDRAGPKWQSNCDVLRKFRQEVEKIPPDDGEIKP